MRESAVMMSSTMPSAKYSCSGSPLMFGNGRTAIDGLSGRISSRGRYVGRGRHRRLGCQSKASGDGPPHLAHEAESLAGDGADQALLAAAVAHRPPHGIDRQVMADSDTIRPPDTAASTSSLLTTRPRFSTRWSSRSNTCGSIAIAREVPVQLAVVGVEPMVFEQELH